MDEEKMLLAYQKELDSLQDDELRFMPRYQTKEEYIQYLKDRIAFLTAGLKAGRGFKR